MNNGDPMSQAKISDSLHIFTLFNLSFIFQRSAHLQVQLCACCSTGILHEALCYFRWFQALSDAEPPEIASGELWTVAATQVRQRSLHLTRTGRAELKCNRPSGVSPVTKPEEMGDQMQPSIHGRRLSYSLLQELLTHVCDLKELKIH